LGEDGLKIMTQPMKNAYGFGEYSKDFIEVTMIALKKKSKATKCSDNFTINLIAHTSKIVASVLRRKVEMKIEVVL
jgi:hypothetical protein